MAQIEKKINMTLDDIIKASSTRTGGGGGAERRQPKAADERIPLPRNGIAPKFIGASSRQPAARATGRPAQNSRALGLGTTRQAPLKKYAQSRAPLHVSIPATNTATATARNAGRPAGKVTDVRVTIPNNRKVRSLPPPGFASDDLPPGMPARGGQAVPGRGARTLNERFTAVLSGPAAAPARRRNTGTLARGGRRGGGGGGGIAPMEM